MAAMRKKRITRLISLITQLQTKRLLTAPELARKFSVSARTIYRDIRTLERAGVPIYVEEGKGYSIMDHYRVPPVMFTEKEANALITAGQLVRKNKDSSLINDYLNAIDKIKSVLRKDTKNKANLLSERTRYEQSINKEKTSDNLSDLQFALTNFYLTKIKYTNEAKESTKRVIEPFALLSTKNWILLAWCRLRKEFRFFRLDRIESLNIIKEKFTPHEMTLREYFDKYY
jgi:predicted DNA-binding transcriptional regulator YafY